MPRRYEATSHQHIRNFTDAQLESVLGDPACFPAENPVCDDGAIGLPQLNAAHVVV